MQKAQQWLVVAPAVAVVALAVALALWVAPSPSQQGQQDAQQTLTNAIGMRFVRIAGGSFTMGGTQAANEQPRREVTVAPFFLARHEVTQAQWQAVMGYNPSRFRNPHRPVEQISWFEAQGFVDKLNELEDTNRYRLPTEAEWEYAARAGRQSPWFFGDESRRLDRYAWYGQSPDEGGGTRPVGRRAASPWGLYDIYGNVWEWVQDCWHDNYRGAPMEARPWGGDNCDLRVVRGGAWDSAARAARSARRGSMDPELRDMATGFRVARTP